MGCEGCPPITVTKFYTVNIRILLKKSKKGGISPISRGIVAPQLNPQEKQKAKSNTKKAEKKLCCLLEEWQCTSLLSPPTVMMGI